MNITSSDRSSVVDVAASSRLVNNSTTLVNRMIDDVMKDIREDVRGMNASEASDYASAYVRSYAEGSGGVNNSSSSDVVDQEAIHRLQEDNVANGEGGAGKKLYAVEK